MGPVTIVVAVAGEAPPILRREITSGKKIQRRRILTNRFTDPPSAHCCSDLRTEATREALTGAAALPKLARMYVNTSATS